ncbi:MAG TPA: hypothetical protein PLD59_02500, partial [Tepidisphaeraceae bacterium]|nr:hypothetical protein [Tepidisphaeraceae bacterium]
HPPAPPPPVPPRMNIPANRPSPVSINRGNQRQKQQKQKKPKKPAQVFAERPFPEAAASPTPVTAPPAVARQPGPAVDAGQLRGWLRPQTLREQFMLTEILQRPLALRPDRD